MLASELAQQLLQAVIVHGDVPVHINFRANYEIVGCEYDPGEQPPTVIAYRPACWLDAQEI